ncbi:MAG: hypothetical protein QM762_25320 [Chryseolinea sp.]
MSTELRVRIGAEKGFANKRLGTTSADARILSEARKVLAEQNRWFWKICNEVNILFF